ncbi:MAG TPA: cupin domain-containing protein [Stellaceae bacterium]|jgi:quercetin dioxygenase-like cupin family protein|nr:cupin domain-containing protein [Stellaceae bacterium]
MCNWRAVAIVLAALGLAFAGPLRAQDVKQTILQKSDVPGTNYETVLGIAEIAPNANVAHHTHPGTESSYVLAGSLTLEVEGQPARMVEAGQSMFVPGNTPHGGRAGANGEKILATLVAEKGKPLATPVK